MAEVFVVDAVRTPLGRLGGGLAKVRPDDLLAAVFRSLAERHPRVGERLDEVYAGNANGAGEDNRNVARMAVLLSGLPVSVPAATVNRLCGSGMEAVISAYRAIALGEADVCIAGGVESMTRAPFVIPAPEDAYPRELPTFSTRLGWRMTNPAMPSEWTVALGEGAEILADKYSIARAAQDEFAVESHRRAHAAWESGRYDAEVIRGSWELVRDECIRADTSFEKLAKLRPVFRTSKGTVTAGNASPMNDGAAALLLTSARAARELDLTPLARIRSVAVSAIEPHLFGLGPVEASQRALKRGDLAVSDLDVVELNEAFAAQVLACFAAWPELDRSKVNPNGGAIALGHPLGCSGARLVGTLAHELRLRGKKHGLATACIGVGQGIAVTLSNG
ncbi:thiolase family protein [Pendulispora brunnea]|uniref:Thiolase family protein n=1 Tax=Pendulispora brunnea TaxID=2905690 RepID=A0ABZ2KE28_9BACT